MNDSENPFATLPREEPPPASLEDRVVARLHANGELRPPPRRTRLLLATAAALCIGFTLGILVPESRPSGRMFVLLLHRGAEAGAPPREEARRVAEYRAWAGTLRARNALVDGAKLKEEATLLGAAKVDDPVAGYFVIAAPDPQAAERLARTCPHLRYGGSIEVREVETGSSSCRECAVRSRCRIEDKGSMDGDGRTSEVPNIRATAERHSTTAASTSRGSVVGMTIVWMCRNPNGGRTSPTAIGRRTLR